MWVTNALFCHTNKFVFDFGELRLDILFVSITIVLDFNDTKVICIFGNHSDFAFALVYGDIYLFFHFQHKRKFTDTDH